MSIAWLSAETPDRGGSGGQRRQYHQIATLLESGVGVQVATLIGAQNDSSVAAITEVSRFGYSLTERRFRRSSRELVRWLSGGNFRAAVVAHVESVQHFERPLRRLGVPWLLDFHNVNWRWAEMFDDLRSVRRWQRIEARALHAASRSTACSAEERSALLQLAPGAHVDVAGHGVDPAEWPESALASIREADVVFFGAWNHAPNREAAEWLLEAIWPRVHADVPEASLQFAGPGFPRSLSQSSMNIHVLGRVDDLPGLLGRTRVVVVPILRGIGTRMKFIEALASGAAVVATSNGAEGFEAAGAFAKADGVEAFSAACVRYLRDGDAAERLGRAGRATALEQHTWEQTSAPLVRWVQENAL